MENNQYHLGLCMAGSVSAGAYIAGVIDYLMEALENWEKEKKSGDPGIPLHQVVIDLLGGSSGGGITSAISYFALRDQLEHPVLAEDGRTVTVHPDKNILWKIWVDLDEDSGEDTLAKMLADGDISKGYVPSALHAGFIDDLSHAVEKYIRQSAPANDKGKPNTPPYLHPQAELFISLFNITGIKYRMYSKGGKNGTTSHFFSEHRDLLHFRWHNSYQQDGCIPLDFSQLNTTLPLLLDAAKATSAFPVGFKARSISRPKKYIWDNPFYAIAGCDSRDIIRLDEKDENDNQPYSSLHSDSGVANNEPVELCRDILYRIHQGPVKKEEQAQEFSNMSDTQKQQAKSELKNTTVILVDPFPASDFNIKKPGAGSEHLTRWASETLDAMNSQLLFDAKQALKAYDKDDYGLTIIEPSKDGVKPEQALACGALAGFSGFLSKEFRIHDFFLGRRNCQSFLRKYFVVNLDEPSDKNRNSVDVIIRGYKSKPEAITRFGFKDKEGNTWVPVIPDVNMTGKIVSRQDSAGFIQYEAPDPLPLYRIQKLPFDHLNQYHGAMQGRLYKLLTNLFKTDFLLGIYIMLGALLGKSMLSTRAIAYIKRNLTERELMEDQ